MYRYLDFETIGSCNRTCPTCLRNSYPDRDAVASWFGKNYLEEELIYDAVEQALAMGFRGGVCLSHYNEPMMDERLPRIAHAVRSYDKLNTVHLNTNGDFITEELAAQLDGALNFMIITLYMDEPIRSERAEWIRSLFKHTVLRIKVNTGHDTTHFSPSSDLNTLIEERRGNRCDQPNNRVIINHRRQYLLCCDDLIGNFDLGTFPEVGIEEYWNGKRREIANTLSENGGRSWHPHCEICPR